MKHLIGGKGKFRLRRWQLIAYLELVIIIELAIMLLLKIKGINMEHKKIKLPEYLTVAQKSLIMDAIKSDIPILVSGVSGPTGKSTLVKMLREQGVIAFEKWECQEIVLSEFFN